MTTYRTNDESGLLLEDDNEAEKCTGENHEGMNQIAKESKTSKSLLALALATLTILVGVFAFSGGSNSGSHSFSLDGSSKYTSISDFDISLKLSAFDPHYDEIDSANDLPWDAVAEPYKTQIMKLESLTIASTDIDISSVSFSWNIDGETYTGSKFKFRVDKTGVINCTLSISYNSNEYDTDFTLAMKYVRREIRSLTDDDRETFLDALHTLYVVPTEKGQSEYGDKYRSAEYFVAKHLNGAGRVDCDHWHDGAGVVTHHMALTLELEQSLQAVDPSIALPYWEYAQDAYLYDNWYDSAVFNDDWFGVASPVNEEHSLDTGRFADIQLPLGKGYNDDWSIADTSSLNPYVNARGVLRSPWNNNPSRSLGRHNTTYGYCSTEMPSCNLMHACYSSNSLSTMNDCLNGVTHGPVHVLVGGLWGQGDLFDDHSISFLQGLDRLLLFKMLWRMGYTRCPTSCSDDEDCACSIPDEYLDTYGPLSILQSTSIYDIISDHINDDNDTEFLTTVLRAIEDPDIAGEMFSSAATFDPLFWPVHGQLERIVSLKRIQISSGEIPSQTFDESWGYSTSEARFLKGVCDWSQVSSIQDLTLPLCNMSTNAYCYGHDENDLLEFSNFLNLDESYTNIEFFEFLHPWNDDLPYVYDTYRFDYCSEYGYDFS